MTDSMPDYPDVVVGSVVVNCEDTMRAATFWSELLGRKIHIFPELRRPGEPDPHEHWLNLEWAPRFGVGMAFQRVPEPKVGTNRLHLDIFCADPEATAERVAELGGRRADGFGDHVWLDPDGNELCILPFPGGS